MPPLPGLRGRNSDPMGIGSKERLPERNSTSAGSLCVDSKSRQFNKWTRLPFDNTSCRMVPDLVRTQTGVILTQRIKITD
jgi:hypothetical protein